jgi:hypothetical protein
MMLTAANASNLTWKKRLGTTPYRAAFGEKKDLSKLRAFGCRAVMYLEEARREDPGRFADRGVEGINLGPAIDANTSAHKVYLIKEKVIRITNQVKFDESYFPMKEAAMRKTPRIMDEVFETEDEFPPEEGDYTVSYDTSLIAGGIKIDSRNSENGTYNCRSIHFPRCKFVMTDEQHQAYIYSLADAVGDQVRQTETRHMLSTMDSAASAVVVAPTVLPPPPYPPPAALSAVAKEGVRMI